MLSSDVNTFCDSRRETYPTSNQLFLTAWSHYCCKNNQTCWIQLYRDSLKACSHYESNAHWKWINSHCLHSHWMCINRNSHWMRIQSIHFHRWFEAGLKVNCIMTWNNAGVIFSRVIGYVKKPAIRQEITNVTLLLHLGKLFYLLCHV